MAPGSASAYSVKRAILVLLTVVIVFLGLGYRNATADPIVRRASIRLPAWPAGTPPLRIALLSDLHVAGPDMPPARLTGIVAAVNAHRPDLVLLAGDFVSDKRVGTQRYSVAEAVAPLAGLTARFGVVAVLGNHDHWRDAAAFRAALPRVGVRLLSNQVRQVGPLVLAGSDDDFTGRADVSTLAAGIAELAGPVVVLSHSPDIAPALPPRARLLLAGHTHCGQIALPLLGRLASMSRYGDRYACGLIRDGRRIVVVGAGLGTSLLPLRYGVPPDWWLLTLGP